MELARRKQLQKICILITAFLMSGSAFAIKLDEAAKQAARNNNAKVLSARTIKQGNKQMHQIKLLTKKGVVKTVRVPANNKKKNR